MPVTVQQGSLGVQSIWKRLAGRLAETEEFAAHAVSLPEAAPGTARWHPARTRNEHSLVFRLDYGEFHMLLTGDMSAEGEKNLLALESVTYDEMYFGAKTGGPG